MRNALQRSKYSDTPSIADTIGSQLFVPYSKVSLTQGLLVYLQQACHCAPLATYVVASYPGPAQLSVASSK